MDSFLSRVFACLFLEFLESGPFKFKIHKNSRLYIIYISSKIMTTKTTDKLNKTEPNVDFNCKFETNNTLPFLEIL